MIALFFAIRRKGSRFGVVRTTIRLIQTREDISREYSFGISAGLAQNNPWTSGAVYLLPAMALISTSTKVVPRVSNGPRIDR